MSSKVNLSNITRGWDQEARVIYQCIGPTLHAPYMISLCTDHADELSGAWEYAWSDSLPCDACSGMVSMPLGEWVDEDRP